MYMYITVYVYCIYDICLSRACIEVYVSICFSRYMLLRMHGQTPHYVQVVGLYWKHLTCIFIQSSFITTFCWKFRVTSHHQGCGIQNMSHILLPFRTDPDRAKQIQTFQAAARVGCDLTGNTARETCLGFPVLPFFGREKLHGRFVDLLLFASMLSLKTMG